MRSLRNFLALICFIGSLAFFIIIVLTFVEPSLEGRGLAVVLTVFCFVLGLFLSTRSKRGAAYERDRLLRGILGTSTVHHLEGLRIAEKTRCAVTIYADRLTVEGGGITFNLTTSQITAVEIKTDVEIANVVQSLRTRIPYGTVDRLELGPLGIVIGTQVINRERRTNKFYFIINYKNSSGEIAALLFQDDITPHMTRDLVKKLKPIVRVNAPTIVQL
ncbi:hypothetical protein [Bacillus sp. FJAT-26390]|uniref:hypothetical protein n=1 Tax=Bacillus sp. FJAT-26390 TaxID=1743142 RepID=UPI000807A5CE|nr:hypothetical protein [Bacillus sp. FJAT-26390]OBZ16720.1 hypothetical protein A7975_02065 [Bacillus sp. FJAT-26390]